jgi:replicative DNA helicase
MSSEINIEKSLLAGLLTYQNLAGEILPLLSPDFFYGERNQKIFIEIIKQFQKKSEYDCVSVSGATKEYTYISELMSEPCSSDLISYTYLIKELHCERKLNEAHLKAKNEVNGLDQLHFMKNEIAEIEKSINIGFKKDSSHNDFVNSLDEQHSDFVITRIPKLDKILGGFERGDVIDICARPSDGKTSLACCIAYNMARYGGHTIDFHSFEMQSFKIRRKIIANMTGIDSNLIRLRTFTDDQLDECMRASEKLNEYQLHIYNSAGKSIDQICFDIQQSKSEIIIIDYLQLVGSKQSNQYQKVTEVSNKLSQANKKKGTRLIQCVQLSRANETEKRPPQLSDLRDSGAIEQDADVVLFIHSELSQEEKLNRSILPVQIIIGKNRESARGYANLIYDKTISRFYEQETYHNVF